MGKREKSMNKNVKMKNGKKNKGENLTRQYPVESVGSFFHFLIDFLFFFVPLGRNHTLCLLF